MKVEAILAAIVEDSGMTKAQIGRAVGIEDKKATDLISKRMKQKNISVNVLVEMLDAMGYTMVVAPKGSKLKDGEFEVSVNE